MMQLTLCRALCGGVLTIAMLLVGPVGCSSDPGPTREVWVDLQRWGPDHDVRYQTQELGNAFRLVVYYPRTTEQMPLSVSTYLAETANQIGAYHARQRGRRINPIRPESLSFTSSRNPLTGRTNWEATTDIAYREPEAS